MIMKKVMQNLIIMLLVIAAGVFIPARICHAASAEVTIGADASEVTVGDRFFVYIYLDSADEFGNFEANLTYDPDILEYKNGAKVITGSDGFLKISDMNVLSGDTSRKYTLEFNALKAGYCDLAFSGRAIVYDLDQNEMSVSKTGLTIHVKAPVTASTNAKLKSMNINPSQLTPSFDPEVTEYSATVSYDTDNLVITALPEDSKATVSISGNDLLKEGENKVIVSVLAESGNIIEYIISVTRESAPLENPAGTVTTIPSETGNSFELVETGGVKYAVYSGRYTILEPDSSVEIPEGYKQGSLILSGITVMAFLPENNEESEFILLYAMNDRQETGFYQYDRVEKTMQRYVPGSLIINQSGADSTENDISSAGKVSPAKSVAVIILLVAASALMTTLTIRLILKLKGRK